MQRVSVPSNAEKALSAEYKNSTPHSKLLVIERKFKTPVHLLFHAFTTADALKAWWWPKGLYADHIEIGFHEGGKYFINMKGYDQGFGGMTGHFEEIVQNKRLVMTDQFADKHGNPITPQEAKMEGTWPELVYITFEFDAIDKTTSRLLLSQQGIPNGMQIDCLQGWSESFDKLEKYLAT